MGGDSFVGYRDHRARRQPVRRGLNFPSKNIASRQFMKVVNGAVIRLCWDRRKAAWTAKGSCYVHVWNGCVSEAARLPSNHVNITILTTRINRTDIPSVLKRRSPYDRTTDADSILPHYSLSTIDKRHRHDSIGRDEKKLV